MKSDEQQTEKQQQAKASQNIRSMQTQVKASEGNQKQREVCKSVQKQAKASRSKRQVAASKSK